MKGLILAAILVQFLVPVALWAAQPTDTPQSALMELEENINDERLLWHIPDPDQALELHARLQAEREADGKKAEAAFHRLVLAYVAPVKRAARLPLTLSETLHRALASNYAIRIESYNPAIETTRVVEAEAAFDATFFLNMSNNKQDVPTTSVVRGSQAQTFLMDGGIRQLLPTGMMVSTGMSLNRTWSNTDPRFQALNPAYFSQFVVKFQQPLLRGFGLDYNRTQINLSKTSRRMADWAFRRQVRNTLLETETAYWRLAQARRLVPVSARLIAGLQRIYEELYERRFFDVLQIQISETKARLEAAKRDHLRILSEVRNAEDRLIALLNDPRIPLTGEVEILPADPADGRSPAGFPRVEVIVDRLAEVQAALDHREEIKEAKLRINNAKLLVGAARNQALPKFDVIFQYSVDGLGKSADRSFDEVTKNDFTEYLVGVELELPVGNRLLRARERRAQLEHSQAIAGLKQVFEQIILDVNIAVRRLDTSFDVLAPNYASLEASEDRLDSTVARAERKDWIQLNQELNAYQGLASARQALLESLATYNVSIVELERSKGTLLEYNGVSMTGEPAP